MWCLRSRAPAAARPESDSRAACSTRNLPGCTVSAAKVQGVQRLRPVQSASAAFLHFFLERSRTDRGTGFQPRASRDPRAAPPHRRPPLPPRSCAAASGYTSTCARSTAHNPPAGLCNKEAEKHAVFVQQALRLAQRGYRGRHHRLRIARGTRFDPLQRLLPQAFDPPCCLGGSYRQGCSFKRLILRQRFPVVRFGRPGSASHRDWEAEPGAGSTCGPARRRRTFSLSSPDSAVVRASRFPAFTTPSITPGLSFRSQARPDSDPAGTISARISRATRRASRKSVRAPVRISVIEAELSASRSNLPYRTDIGRRIECGVEQNGGRSQASPLAGPLPVPPPGWKEC